MSSFQYSWKQLSLTVAFRAGRKQSQKIWKEKKCQGKIHLMQNPYCCNPIYSLSSRWISRRGSQFFRSLAQGRILLSKSWEHLPLLTACFACISFANQSSALGSEFLSVHCKQQQGYCVLRLFWECPGIWPLLLIKILGTFYWINLQ